MMPLGDSLLRPRCDPVFRIGGGFSAQPIVSPVVFDVSQNNCYFEVRHETEIEKGVIIERLVILSSGEI